MLGRKHWKNDTLSIVFPSSLNCNMIKVYPEKSEDKRIIYTIQFTLYTSQQLTGVER